ncbi:hypothetical protein BD626DRAFT_636524 [Schizophyllum amplum]|uniref:F-box domain-containing protein n=1 Tax=Schizophyllum amplum TaxID=97359 RepID=A0A550BT62_9AGAR|nr:hypothetical protein BD626DRAFT_636524 [Auriculariopsis ampla]
MPGVAEEVDESVPNAAVESAGARLSSIYELFLMICKLLVDDGGLSTLLNFATACRAMSDVALDLLWEKQIHLGNLLLTIPRVESSWVIRYRSIDMSSREVKRLLLKLPEESQHAALTEAEYASFLKYARRIKIFGDRKHMDDPHVIIDRRLLRAIIEYGPILPNAHTIKFRSSEQFAFGGMKIVSQCDGTTTPPISSSYAWVSLAGQYYNNHTTSMEYRAIVPCASLSNIRALTIPPGEHFEGIPHLRGLPCLEELHLVDITSCSGFIRSERRPTPPPGFRALRSLRLSEAEDFDAACEVVRLMSSEPLRLRTFKHHQFNIYGSDRDNEQLDAMRFYGTLRQCLDHDSLTKLHVSTGRAVNVRSARLFSDLRVFKNVSVVAIYVNYEGADLDSALDILTAAWPSLTRLYFFNRGANMTRVSFEGLIPLATRCPALDLLKIPLETRRPAPKPIHLLNHQVLRDRLVELDVQRTRPPEKQEDIDLLVDFLASVFPDQTLRYIWAASDYFQTKWRQLFDRVWQLCHRRMQPGSQGK